MNEHVHQTTRFLVLAVVVGIAVASPAVAGPVILGGDDLTDHGSVTGTTVFDGWLYIQRALENLAPSVTRSGNDGSVAVLGSADSTATSDNAGAAYHFAVPNAAATTPLSGVVSFHNGATDINTFFTDLASGAVNPAIIVTAGTGASNDLSSSEGTALVNNALAIANFVNSGGGLLSHGSGSTAYGWLSVLIPGVTFPSGCDETTLSLTVAGQLAFPGLTDADIRSGPCHNNFVNHGLTVLAVDGSSREIIIGGVAVVLPGQLTLMPSVAFNPPGTTHTVTALVIDQSMDPLPGITVTFEVTAGPNVGTMGTVVTDSSGNASFSYLSNGSIGLDTIEASFLDPNVTPPATVVTTALKFWDLDCQANGIPDTCDFDCAGFGGACAPNFVACGERPGPMVYISNTDSNNVSVVDMAAEAVVAMIPVGNNPRGIDISPDNRRVYVANRGGDSVSVIDTVTNMVVQLIDLASSSLVTADEPYDVVVSPDGKWLYVAMQNGGSQNGDGTVVVVELPAGSVVAEVILDSNASPEGIVVTPDGQRVYVAAQGSMYIVDVSTPASPSFLGTTGSAGRELVVSPDGAWVYANDNAIRTSDDMAFGTGESSGELGITISPDGLTLYSTDQDSFVKVVSVDLSGGTPMTTFVTNITDSTQFASYGIDLTEEGDRGVVSFLESNTVRIFDAVTHAFIGPVIPMIFTPPGLDPIFGVSPRQLVIAHADPDCNGNAIADRIDIAMGCSQDCNGNGIPDECEDDCNGNGIPDECDLVGDLTATGLSGFTEPRLNGGSDYFHFVNPLAPANDLVGAVNSMEGAVKDVAVDPTTGLVYTVGIPLVTSPPTGIGNGDQYIYLVNTDTGAGTALPQPTGYSSIAGLTFGSDGTFFGIGDGFFTIDKTTGAAQLVNAGVYGFGMATSATGQIYSISCSSTPTEPLPAGVMPEVGAQEVLQLHDPVTGDVITSIALMINGPEATVIDIAFGTGGILYGISGFDSYGFCNISEPGFALPAPSNLCIIDPATGGITLVGPLNTNMLGLGGPLPDSASPDCNDNGIPDECDPDCDGDGVPDDCDITPETEPPVITGCPESISGSLDSDCQFSPAPEIEVDVTDNCTATADLVVTAEPADLTSLGVGEHTVTVTVTDEAGNFTRCTVKVTIDIGDCDVAPTPQQPPCVPSDGAINILLSLIFHSPVCGIGVACPLMIMLTICGMLSLRARRRRRP